MIRPRFTKPHSPKRPPLIRFAYPPILPSFLAPLPFPTQPANLNIHQSLNLSLRRLLVCHDKLEMSVENAVGEVLLSGSTLLFRLKCMGKENLKGVGPWRFRWRNGDERRGGRI